MDNVTSEKKTKKLDKRTKIFLITWLVLCILLLWGSFAAPAFHSDAPHESVTEMMKDAVLHTDNRVAFFGMEVNPSVISAFTVTGILLIFALIVRLFVIPKFKTVPGKFQLLLETVVGLFDNMAVTNSPWRHGFMGVYIFVAGVYIFVGTLFELVGAQVLTTSGRIVALPAPLADINSCLTMGILSYCIILFGAIISNGFSGFKAAIIDASLLISLSFRLFGALLSGLLVTELVYYYKPLSYVLPVIVAVLFTMLHALIQAYVLTTLVSMFYGEKTEPPEAHAHEENNQYTI